jgi:hypothetical protein
MGRPAIFCYTLSIGYEEPSMQTVKQIVHDVADHLPEQATWDDAMYVMYVRQKIDEGLRDIAEGRTYTQEEVEAYLLGGKPRK